MEHTPGPWEAKMDYDNEMSDNIISGRHTIRDKKEGWNIARIWESAPNGKSNAHLIAAAPDLLEACYNALTDLAYYLDEREEDFAIDKTYQELKRAIAKAEGKGE